MRSMLVIGMGRFGKHLARQLHELGNEVMIVDEKEESLQDMLQYSLSAQIGDCTNEEVLRSLGVNNWVNCSHEFEWQREKCDRAHSPIAMIFNVKNCMFLGPAESSH